MGSDRDDEVGDLKPPCLCLRRSVGRCKVESVHWVTCPTTFLLNIGLTKPLNLPEPQCPNLSNKDTLLDS